MHHLSIDLETYSWCEKDDCANDDKIHHLDAEALDMAIAALRAQQEQESKPLNGIRRR